LEKAIRPLIARERIENITDQGMGAGVLKKSDRSRIMADLKRALVVDFEPVRATSGMLAALGIKVVNASRKKE